MDEEKIKSLLQEEIKSLQEGLDVFVKTEDMQAEVKKLSDKVEELGIAELKTQIETLQNAADEMGIELKKRTEDAGPAREKTLKELLTEKADDLAKMQTDKHASVSVIKTVTAANVTDDTMAYRAPGVGQIQRGYPWLRELFNVIPLGPNSHGTVAYYEQLAVTNNAANVAEGGASATQSNLTWVEKTIGGKRIHDFIKLSKNQIKDVDFVAGETQRLIDKNMRLKENSQLLTGLGTGNEIKGITKYAQVFATAGISINNANLNDLIGKIKTQIRVNSLDGFLPDFYACNSPLVDTVRFAKDEFGQYVFPMWAQGAPVAMQGLQPVENNLIADDSLLVGDAKMATLYEWDGMTIEYGFIDDDFTKGLVTVSAYLRENLLVRENDVQAFVYSTAVADLIGAITAGA